MRSALCSAWLALAVAACAPSPPAPPHATGTQWPEPPPSSPRMAIT